MTDKPTVRKPPGPGRRLACLYRRQRAVLATVLETVGEAVTVVDENRRVVAWNQRAAHLYGIAAADIVGRPIDDFFSNLVVTRMLAEPQAVKDKYHRPRAGTHVLINAAPVTVGGRVAGGVSAERDITELVNLNRELTRASQEVISLKEEIDKMSSQADPFAAISGHSADVLEAVAIARRVAGAGVPVLIRGESGTGKEVFARAIHAASRRSGPFAPINCGAIPANLFESELFGYQPGAFTGADRRGKLGLFETADGGTLFLDEIGELPKEMQVKLLRVLQDKSFHRVGGGKPVRVDVRIIAATHRNLEEMIASGDFRDDLYYRLNVVSLQLPPLRDRREDIPELVHRGLQHFAALHGKQISRVEPALMAVFLDHSWPGNVRELFNILERIVVLADGDTLGTADLPAALRQSRPPTAGRTAAPATLPAGGHGVPPITLPDVLPAGSVTLPAAEGLLVRDMIEQAFVSGARPHLITATGLLERQLIEQALAAAGGNKAKAAAALGIPRSTLYYKMQATGLRQKTDSSSDN